MTTATKRAAIYGRVSSRYQEDNTSLATQLEDCQHYAREHGYDVADDHLYRDVVTAETLIDRPDALAMMDAARAGKFAAIVFWKFDRVTREQIDWALIVDACRKGGVEIYSATEGRFDNSPTGKFLTNAAIFASELELAKIKERTTRGKRKRVESGKLYVGSVAAEGYRFVLPGKERYEIDESRAWIVRRMFHEASQGKSMRSIAQELTDEGIPTRQGAARWDATVIRQILTNPAYMGKAVTHRTRTEVIDGKKRQVPVPPDQWIQLPDAAPAIVDVDTYERVQEKLQTNKENSARNLKHPERYLLRGYLRCGGCGGRLGVGFYKGNHYYRCMKANRHKGACSYHHQYQTDKLDLLIWDKIIISLRQTDELEKVLRARQHTPPDTSRLAVIEKALADNARKERNLARFIMALDDDADQTPYLEQSQALTRDNKRLADEREKLEAQHTAWEVGEREILSVLTLSEQINTFWGFVSRVLSRAGRRALLEGLDVRVEMCHPTDTPPYVLTANIPLFATITLPDGDGGEMHLGADCFAGATTSTRPHKTVPFRWAGEGVDIAAD